MECCWPLRSALAQSQAATDRRAVDTVTAMLSSSLLLLLSFAAVTTTQTAQQHQQLQHAGNIQLRLYAKCEGDELKCAYSTASAADRSADQMAFTWIEGTRPTTYIRSGEIYNISFTPPNVDPGVVRVRVGLCLSAATFADVVKPHSVCCGYIFHFLNIFGVFVSV